jgi:RNA polymerase sigma factor (sigma-70 family)
MTEEEEAVIAARSGDVEAFSRLVDARATLIYRICYSIVRSHGDAEDAAQETFFRAWRELPKLRDPSGWPGWLRTIAVRTSIDRTRKLRRVEPLTSEAIHATNPIAATDSRDEIERAMASMSSDDRAILAMRYYLDLAVPELANTLGIPLGTAKSRLHRALGRLRQVLEEQR